ncbi:hypothetical protein JHK85_056243 [Glycine max]|nr:hypothetical protein JHK85_056243 [Glycine max]
MNISIIQYLKDGVYRVKVKELSNCASCKVENENLENDSTIESNARKDLTKEKMFDLQPVSPFLLVKEKLMVKSNTLENVQKSKAELTSRLVYTANSIVALAEEI